MDKWKVGAAIWAGVEQNTVISSFIFLKPTFTIELKVPLNPFQWL